MILIGNLKNRLIILAITLFVIGIIGFLDYITGEELSFSIFYIIPISLLALYRDTKLFSVILCAGFAALIWFYSDYTTRDYSSILFPIWNAFVRLSIFILVGSLLLYLKEKDKRLKSANDSLKALNEEKNKFIGIAAHDLRSPMSSTDVLSGLILEHHQNEISPRVAELLDMIRTLCKNSLVVLKNLLDISKIESGNIDLNFKEEDYILFIKQQVQLNQLLASHKRITIRFDTQMDRLIMVFDHHYLSEVIDNLLSNAIKYSYEGSEIVVKISNRDQNQILTEVTDTGKGIPSEEQEKLFNYFQKTSTRPTGRESSTGLGLAIAKRIIVLHQGEIGVKSVVNEGSTFYYTLPL